MTTPKLRRPTGPSYMPVHPRFAGLSNWARSCGKCGAHFQSKAGDKKHPILGFVCGECRR